MESIRILFVCVENACRSQMAEAWARHEAGDRINAHSAGSRPRGEVDPTAFSVMQERGLDLSRHSSKGFSELPPITWDVLVTMGCGDACPQIPAHTRVDWQIPDPARQPVETYRNIRDLIEKQVSTLLKPLSSPLRERGNSRLESAELLKFLMTRSKAGGLMPFKWDIRWWIVSLFITAGVSVY